MADPWRRFNCRDCGQPTRRKRGGNDPLVCFDCGLAAHTASITAMVNHEGAYWDRWLGSMAAAVARLHAERNERQAAAQAAWDAWVADNPQLVQGGQDRR